MDPNVKCIAAELRLGPASVSVGFARDASGRVFVTGGLAGPLGMIDAGVDTRSGFSFLRNATVSLIAPRETSQSLHSR